MYGKLIAVLSMVLLTGCAATAVGPADPVGEKWDFDLDGERYADPMTGLGRSLMLFNFGGRQLSRQGGPLDPDVQALLYEGINLPAQEVHAIVKGMLQEALWARGARVKGTSAGPEGARSTPQTGSLGAHLQQPRLEVPALHALGNATDSELTTTWQPVQGKRVGLWIWARRNEAEARHIVRIVPSLRLPARTTNFSIATEVRERPDERWPWRSGDPALGQESLDELRSALLLRIAQRSKSMTRRR
jgi:hypothetical protein